MLTIKVTLHALQEWRKHGKVGSNLKGIANYFSKSPVLIESVTYSLPRRGRPPKLKRGRTSFLTRGDWKYSKFFLVLIKEWELYIAVTTLSGREFRRSITREIILMEDIKKLKGKITFIER